MIKFGKCEIRLKEAVTVYLEVLYRHLTGRTEENHEIPQSVATIAGCYQRSRYTTGRRKTATADKLEVFFFDGIVKAGCTMV
jgi:hypothetical protein